MNDFQNLSPEIITKAVDTAASQEYAWPPELVEEVINDACLHGLSTVGGVAQFRLPDGTCEMYWIAFDTSPRRENEKWSEFVDRTGGEAVQMFREIMASNNFEQEIANWPFLRNKQADGVDVMSYLCFVLYFDAEPCVSGRANKR